MRSKRTSERCEGGSEQANERASGPVLQSVFLVFLAHNGRGGMTVVVEGLLEVGRGN